MHAMGDWVAAGGMGGELLVRRRAAGGLALATTVAPGADGGGITNGVELSVGGSGRLRAVLSSNDCALREVDVATGRVSARVDLGHPVNFAAACAAAPDLCVVAGDSREGAVVDLREDPAGGPAVRLLGHEDFNFAAAWHPAGHLVATGGQDLSARVYDLRRGGGECAHRLGARMAAIRSLHFSSDGALLAAAEAADFVHLQSVADWGARQEVDFFSEVSGAGFSPSGDALFVGLAEPAFGGVLEFQRHPLSAGD